MLSLQLGELCKENASVKGQIVALEETIRRSQPCEEVGRNILSRAEKGWDHMCKTVIRSTKGTY